MVDPPKPLPRTHLAQVDCIDCGAVVLAAPHKADQARCSTCWEILIWGHPRA